ncbi:hypothetical protein HPB49_016818 [Dermacentor silvarum]|uniref:Uncharacterized protein n=1 Tax=Dermacentor silvarum TaxID=543639 RepID=A0ACB8CG48_DERSI|nr:hypothetical protein HPB49_016818 [Dermacentor silvarum]
MLLEDQSFVGVCERSDFAFVRGLPNFVYYWAQRKRDVFATIRQLGKPTLFLTLSTSELHEECLLKISENLNEPVEEHRHTIADMHAFCKMELVNNDPLVCALFVGKLVLTIIKVLQSIKTSPFGKHQVVDFFKQMDFHKRVASMHTCLLGSTRRLKKSSATCPVSRPSRLTHEPRYQSAHAGAVPNPPAPFPVLQTPHAQEEPVRNPYGTRFGTRFTVRYTFHLLKDTYNLVYTTPGSAFKACVATSTTEKAATAFGGTTLHSALNISINKDDTGLRYSDLNTCRCGFESLKSIFVDQVSMMGSEALVKMDNRIRKITQQFYQPFGNIDIYLGRDQRQLSPVKATEVYGRSACQIRELSSECPWKSQQYHSLVEVVRQQDVVFCSLPSPTQRWR